MDPIFQGLNLPVYFAKSLPYLVLIFHHSLSPIHHLSVILSTSPVTKALANKLGHENNLLSERN